MLENVKRERKRNQIIYFKICHEDFYITLDVLEILINIIIGYYESRNLIIE